LWPDINGSLNNISTEIYAYSAQLAEQQAHAIKTVQCTAKYGEVFGYKFVKLKLFHMGIRNVNE
jgi:hypothetical protein